MRGLALVLTLGACNQVFGVEVSPDIAGPLDDSAHRLEMTRNGNGASCSIDGQSYVDMDPEGLGPVTISMTTDGLAVAFTYAIVYGATP